MLAIDRIIDAGQYPMTGDKLTNDYDYWQEKKYQFLKKSLILLHIGTSNWDYYQDGNMVFCIAKEGSGCRSSGFGNLDYFNYMKSYTNL